MTSRLFMLQQSLKKERKMASSIFLTTTLSISICLRHILIIIFLSFALSWICSHLIREMIKVTFVFKSELPCVPLAPCDDLLHQAVVYGLLPFIEPDTIQPNSHNPPTKASLNTTITNMGMSPLLQCVEWSVQRHKRWDPANILIYHSWVAESMILA